jgi:nicotinamide phosphoribosyltransferase
MAVKATWCQIDGVPREIFKDPVTDDGMKKSAKGLLRVDLVDGEYVLRDQCTPEEERGGCLKTVFLNGTIVTRHTLAEIRERVA